MRSVWPPVSSSRYSAARERRRTVCSARELQPLRRALQGRRAGAHDLLEGVALRCVLDLSLRRESAFFTPIRSSWPVNGFMMYP